jgi:hypothetical protein
MQRVDDVGMNRNDWWMVTYEERSLFFLEESRIKREHASVSWATRLALEGLMAAIFC